MGVAKNRQKLISQGGFSALFPDFRCWSPTSGCVRGPQDSGEHLLPRASRAVRPGKPSEMGPTGRSRADNALTHPRDPGAKGLGWELAGQAARS